jgi:hypothetical protein
MSLGILGRSGLGEVATKYHPWGSFSKDTLALQLATNQALQAAGFCPVPSSGILDGATCGARSSLTIHSREHFGRDMVFARPPACLQHDDEQIRPTPGCFEPTGEEGLMKLTGQTTPEQSRNWILIGGTLAAALAVALVIQQRSKKA